MAIRKDLGIATAYGYAVSKGYTGTEEEFAELMASYASVGQTATQAAESASASATASAGSAAQSAQSATNAQTAAEGAVQAAEQELEGYVASANQKATEAAQSAANASTSATNAAGSATDAGTEALKAEGVTLGKQNGVDVGSDSPYYHANAKYYSEQAQATYDQAVAVKDSIPQDYTALSADVDDLKADLNDVADEVYNKTALAVSSTLTGWRLKENGLCEGNSSYKMDKYQVTAGDTLYIISDHLFQFQPSASVPSGGTPNRIGDTYGTGQYTLEVPENATYLIVSTLTSESGAAVYLVSGKLDDVVTKVNNLESVTLAVESDTEKTKMYGMAVRDVIGGTNRQIVNLTGLQVKSSGTSYKFYDVNSIPFTQNGDYYPNPLGECQIPRVYALNESGTALKYNGGNYDNFNIDQWDKFTRVDDRTIIRTKYSNESNFRKGIASRTTTYSYAEDVKFIKLQYLKNSGYNNPVDLGITYNLPSISYIPYGVDPQYNPFMFDVVWNRFVSDNKFYDVPAKRLNPWMQRSYAITDNLLDDRKIDWVGDGNFYKMKHGETVPVEGGRTVVCSKNMYTVKWYDENGVETSLPNSSRITLPSDAVAIRFDVWRGTGETSIPAEEYQPIYLYYADSKLLYTYDDVDRTPVPMAQINGWDINKNVYDMAIPEVGSNIVRMMKTFAIRELNHQRNAIRIGTFNIYINNTRTNRPTIKKELETYGIDICGFQEARLVDDSGNQLNIGDYLKNGWQFAYCNTNQHDPDSGSSGRALVSAYEVLSSEEVAFTGSSVANNKSYLKCVIRMPQYKHYADGTITLSIYNYHGDSTSATARAEQVAQIIDAVAQDTSDFIIVLGDTNDFSDDHSNWQSFANAGLTPVHNGKSSTTTTDGWSIDQIFVSEHITCLYYDVVNSNDWKYKPTPTSAEQPVSDHDFLYADLRFDFEAVLNARDN